MTWKNNSAPHDQKRLDPVHSRADFVELASAFGAQAAWEATEKRLTTILAHEDLSPARRSFLMLMLVNARAQMALEEKE